MSDVAKWIARWRVRLGYPLAIVVLFFARPNPKSILIGAGIGIVGLWLRAYAAGYLKKQEVLTTTGPYAFTRNPLYLGSAILAAGAAWATHSWISAVILFVYFASVYLVVMRREEGELRGHFGEAFEVYAKNVPLFFPRPTPARVEGSSPGEFSFAQYRKNHEHQAALGFVFLLALLFAIWRLRGG
ncbi:MAG: isoprenylcysteine carboxylmethyltransferase family protein [Acidobacteria bacterium]|nr:isoprenylcysteine carboxylmethyltransferase family protein [Acidobacteriota bacterium]MBS1867330.1 isoprenylcysteine carboxylmethyltransferase family protein [Acidobacteriota bacterium]